MRCTFFTPRTAQGVHGKTVGRWVGHFAARVKHFRRVSVGDVVVERFDDGRRVGRSRSGVLLGAVRCQEPAVVRIASHGTEDHTQVASAARTTADQIQRLAKVDQQIGDLF